ncbi:uncharacterized protein EI97DRAFT_466621 [Westerdykella ornata]|uniref:Uncharacterized protein n=1 Tax=Westerdykella ornata TaxID=318751 RepID=A0A6A6JKF6_WESOR|nr:uncharacterized protein EI97DRAFT_466621 [Westerdykella ornata]KAF2277081.1 hypothetical protein EI97DRAFT_466621 [Westerdykella ornata]
MLRSGASRLASSSFMTPMIRPTSTALNRSVSVQWNAKLTSMATQRPRLAPMARLGPLQATLRRRTMADKIDREAEKKYAHEKLEPTPETVTSSSTMQPVFGGKSAGKPLSMPEPDMTAGLRGDIKTIRDTFDLSEVPRQAYYIGLAGVLPYLATCLSTVACAYDINHDGYGYFLSAKNAETLLHILEPIQIGYGAVILSFLGAIHWGLEFGGYGGYHGYRRYAIGVIAPAVAWPTMLMPVEYALISQFCAFMGLYYVDTKATAQAWTPPWYAIYRFVLTGIVGASIAISLMGRGEVADKLSPIPGAVDRIKTLREGAGEELAKHEEALRVQNAAKQAESEGGEGRKSRAT